jgi:hypothetical protein
MSISRAALVGLVFGFALTPLTHAGVDGDAGVARDRHEPIIIEGTDARVRAFTRDGRVRRLYGDAFSHGASPRQSAEAFLDRGAAALGTRRVDLAATGPFEDGRHVQPVMYDAETASYRFTAIYYTQQRDGIPVFRSRLTLLVRNDPGHPLVLASADLRDVDPGFRPVLAAQGKGDAPGIAAVRAARPDMIEFTDARAVIWAGVEDMFVAPVLAHTFIADNGRSGTPAHERHLYVTDAVTGAILFDEDQILEVDLAGHTGGYATEGQGADICGPEEIVGLPYARVSSNVAPFVYADFDGNWVIADAGEELVTVKSSVRGRYFRVFNQELEQELITQVVTPPGPVEFVHNPDNTEFRRAEVNTYIHANVARDFALSFNPDYPVIADQLEMRINVNIDLNCNATYSGSAINFYSAGGGCPNTGFSSVVYHEYGHHLVSTGGSGQGPYGEGMSDTVSVLIFDDPGLAYGFRSNCDEPLRRANNNCRYRESGCSTCGDSVHGCGRLLSGCVWSTRNELLATNPDDYLDILSNIAINSILVHTGSSITPAITVDFLVLDDNNSTLLDGTPHYNQIAAGFGDHDMDAPPLTCGADLDGSGAMDTGDLVALLAAWGPCGGCAEDFTGDDVVDTRDLVLLLSIWGPCP